MNHIVIAVKGCYGLVSGGYKDEDGWLGIYDRRTGYVLAWQQWGRILKMWVRLQDPLNQTELVRYRGQLSNTIIAKTRINPLGVVKTKTKWRGY